MEFVSIKGLRDKANIPEMVNTRCGWTVSEKGMPQTVNRVDHFLA